MAGTRDKAGAVLNKANSLFQSGRYPEALQAYDEALKLKPDYPEAWSNKGVALGKLGRNEEALQAYDEALKLKPDYPEAWYNKGVALGKLGRSQEALHAYDEALKLKPGDPEAWNNKGNTLFYADRYKEALDAYGRATGLKPDFSRAWYNKSLALHRLGRGKEALEAVEKALRLAPELKEAKELRARLRAEGVNWWMWWFGVSWPRRLGGGLLVLILAACAVFPLLKGDIFCIVNTGKTWEYYIIPALVCLLLLLSPSIRWLRAGPLHIELSPISATYKREAEPLISTFPD